MADASADITSALEAFRFNEAAGAAYRFVWNLFCDWYVEFTKPVLQGEETAARDETQATTAFVLDGIFALLHPFMPFITEELWAIKGEDGPARGSVLALSPWPELGHVRDAEAAEEFGWLIDLVSTIRSVRAELNVPSAAQIPLVLAGGSDAAQARLERWDGTLKRLARLSTIETAAEAPRGTVQLPVVGGVAALPLAEFIDVAAERKRLDKDAGRAEADAEKLSTKLANPGFMAKATEEVIAETRERVADLTARAAKLRAALAQLGPA